MEVLNAVEAFLRIWLMHVATGFGASVTHVLTLAGSGSTPTPPSFEDVLKGWTGYLADGVEGCAGLVIAFAAIQATIRAILLFFRKPRSDLKTQVPQTENIRLRLGRWLALALEFELAADILRTAIAPTWDQIAQLAAIAAIRTALNYFLQQEIDRATERQRHLHEELEPERTVPRSSEVPSMQPEHDGVTARQNNVPA